MDISVFTLAEEDTNLFKKTAREFFGQCPNYPHSCSSSKDGFIVRYDAERDKWSFMCRNCWDPKHPPIRPDMPRFGDEIDYLRHFKRMPYSQAKEHLAELRGKVDTALERVRRVQSYHAQTKLQEDQALQDIYQEYIRAAVKRLDTPDGKPCLDYLLSRGLRPDIIREFQLGSITSETLRNKKLAKIEVDTQFIVIPWYADGKLWRVQLRDIRPDCPQPERYRNFPRSGESLYQGDCLKRKLPTFLVEDEFSAITIAQEASDIVNVVATGSVDRGHTTKWEVRLACVPSVLVALDRDKDGDKASKEWLRLLNGATIAKRWKPLVKDANDMLKQGYNVRTWVQAALDYLNPSPVGSEPETIEPDLLSICSLPGCSSEVFTFVGDANEGIGKPFCEAHYQALQLEISQENVVTGEQSLETSKQSGLTREQFQAIAEQFASALPGEWPIGEILPAGSYTIKDRVRAIEEQQRAYNSDMWQARRKAKAR